MNKVTQEFLEAHGFSLKSFPDGKYWVRFYTASYFMQVSESLDIFIECGESWVEQLSCSEFIDNVKAHQRAIENK